MKPTTDKSTIDETSVELTRIVVLDVSGSMQEPFSTQVSSNLISRLTLASSKFEAAKEYVRFAIQKMPEKSNLIIIAFGNSAKIVYQGSVKDAPAIEARMADLNPSGGTNLGLAFQSVLELLAKKQQNINVLDVITDGLSNKGDPIPPAIELRKQRHVFLRLFLIDAIEGGEGMTIARAIIGDECEGEIEPVTSAIAFEHQKTKLSDEAREHMNIEFSLERQLAERHALRKSDMHQNRPRITAIYPESVAVNNWRTVEIFIYLKSLEGLVRRELERLRSIEDSDYGEASAQFPKSLPVGSEIKVALSSDEMLINPPEIRIFWLEPLNRLPFRIIPKDKIAANTTAAIDVDVYVNELPVAAMRVSIVVGVDSSRRTAVLNAAAWFEEIFASYVREDLALANDLKERYAALGLHLFIDVEDLRAGVKWRPALFQQIDSSDLFQLFWSTQSKVSKNVEIEWRHALQIQGYKGERFIRPIYWEFPMPEPPPELADLNFRAIRFLSNSDAQVK